MIELNGTTINYYIHCKRQCYLFYHRLNLEDQSELVHVGRELHEMEKEKNKNAEISIENIKIDKITKDYVIEIKKSDADKDAARWQLYYYLYVLSKKGILKKGKLEYIEHKKRKTEIIELTEQKTEELQKIINQVHVLVNKEKIPEAKRIKGCTKCAYYEYCFI